MGGCSASIIEDSEVSSFTREQFLSSIRKDVKLPIGFDDPKLVQTPLQAADIDRFEKIKQACQANRDQMERLPHVDSKFPQLSPPIGPLGNIGTSLIYYGSVKDGLPHGWGEAVSQEGFYYKGYFEEGIPNYFGRLSAPDGSIYEGGLYRFTRDGFGKLTLSNGIVQEGEWKFDQLFCTSHSSMLKHQSDKKSDQSSNLQYLDSLTGMKLLPKGDHSPPIESRYISPLPAKANLRVAKERSDDGFQIEEKKPPVRSCFKKLTGERKPSDRHISFLVTEIARSN